MLMISIRGMDKKELHTHAHRLLRECLRPLGIDYGEDTPVTKGKMGKPSLADRPDIHYNLSHAKGIAACIVSEQECGIDCEKVRERRPNVMKRAFSANERQMVESASAEERDLLFFRLWTLKEAYVKALGTGISYPMDKAEFSFRGGEIVTDIKDCRFRQYIISGGKYVVSVCELMKQAQ
ncbi:4'-phosphopantetheinyl transferase superfamily protein [Ruminococcus sp.]|uniref:4'-phosphopantetheinyl transferase family protein n=1 Tax=Ruminococcus sp. TaxID=41978 RepID=UPI0025E914D0|nr:4'-phosphopantetheinyl transferase superfamily protein [Ruminococcus sp.]MBQ6251767.1 4'-phosphopantetheinyl transferase superfamily protein [Ruminococcus sp.]